MHNLKTDTQETCTVSQASKSIDFIFSETWNFLNQKRCDWSSNDLNTFLKLVDVLKSQKQQLERLQDFNEYKHIFLQYCNEPEKQFLESKGLSVERLYSSFRLTEAHAQYNLTKIKARTKAKKIPIRFHRGYGNVLREYQDEVLTRRYFVLTCPFTEMEIKSTHSFPIGQAIFYRFESQEVFYVISFINSTGYHVNSIYFPHLEILVNAFRNVKSLQNNLISFVNKLRLELVLDLHSLSTYLLAKHPKKIIVHIGNVNFAHHLHNELEALQRLLDRNLLDKIDEFWVTSQPLGSIDLIYPEIPANKLKLIQDINVLNKAINECSFSLKVGDMYVSENLKSRIFKVSIENSQPSVIELVNHAKQNCFPLLWVSIRLVNRTCVNQIDAFFKIITKLAQTHPNLGVVFDGFSLPIDRLSNPKYKELDYQEDNIEKANKLVENLISLIHSKCSSIQIFNTVGCTLAESIVWAHTVNFYLCHHGTTQHKIGWLTDKPGIVHSNRETLSRSSYPEAKGSWLNCKNAIFLSEEDVTDDEIPDEYKNDFRKNLKNYYLKWERAYEELLKLSLLPLRG
ncbi:MAG: hypothetical protein SWY16_10285 [Cyanobacteriota bacterium]|nr:hypothetical protein [Cyanobacteriota bacterium]